MAEMIARPFLETLRAFADCFHTLAFEEGAKADVCSSVLFDVVIFTFSRSLSLSLSLAPLSFFVNLIESHFLPIPI